MKILQNLLSSHRVLLLIICIVFASCTSSVDPDEQEKINRIEATLDESVKFHDEVMPLMSEMGSLHVSILQTLDSAATDTLDKTHKLAVANELKSASDAMMDWMKNFTKPPRTEDLKNYELNQLDSILSVQKEQLEEITRINQSMKQAVEDGRQLIPRE